MKKYWVYIHTCPNGKKYVGITTASKPERRWLKGRGYQHNDHFSKAILKYGWDNITHEVFEVESEEEMYRKEIELISFYHSNDPNFGYNLSSGGEKSALGCIRSKETRRKHSEDNLKRWADPEYRKKISEAMKGKTHPSKPHSEEAKKKISEANKKRWSDPEVRRKMSESLKGRTLSEETRKRISEAKKGKTLSEETKRRISETLKGKLHSEEVRKHMSEVHKGKTFSEEHRKHMSEARKGKPHSEEARKHMSESHKGKSFSEEHRKHMSEVRKGKSQPRVKIKLPDGTIIEMSKQNLTRNYINKGKEFEYLTF